MDLLKPKAADATSAAFERLKHAEYNTSWWSDCQ